MRKLSLLVVLTFSLLCVKPETVYAQYYLELLQKGEITNYYELENKVEEYYSDKSKGKGSGYKQWKRWSMENSSYKDSEGEMINKSEHLYKTYHKYIKDHPQELSRATNGYWTSEGPIDYTYSGSSSGGNGRISVMVEDPLNLDILYVGCPKGGLFKSIDAGETWLSLTSGMPQVGVSGIAVDPFDNNNVFILTGDGDGGGSGIGVFKSEDGGLSWVKTGVFAYGGSGYKLIMDPTDPNKLFAATTKGLYRSYDGGESWLRVISEKVFDVELRPNNPNTVYASSISGFYRSGDSGANFDQIFDNDFPTTSWKRTAIAVSQDNDAYVYLVFGGSNDLVFDGMFRSTNTGFSFTFRSDNSNGGNNVLGNNCDADNLWNQVNYDLGFEVDPNDSSVLYLGGTVSFKSLDGGISWSCMTDSSEPSGVEYIHADIHNFIAYGERLYACTDGGIYFSADQGENFINKSIGLDISEIYDFDIYDGNMSFGMQDNGSGIMDESITTYTHSLGGDGLETIIDYEQPNYIYQCTQNNRYRSSDGGITITNITPTGLTGNWGSPWEIDPNFPTEMWVGHYNGQLRRTLSARTVSPNTWDFITIPIPPDEDVLAICKSQTDSELIYIVSQATIAKSTNASASNPDFDYVSPPNYVGEMSDIAIDYNQSSLLYVSYSSLGDSKVFVSFDSGLNWTDYSEGLPDVPVKVIEVDQGITDGVYIGTDIGVFYRNLNMSEWIPFGNGMPISYVWDLKISGNKLYAATYGRGIWSTSLYSACPSYYTLNTANDPSSDNYTGPQTYYASDYISSNRIITGGLGTDVHYYTEGYVELLEGFIAKENNKFVATLKDCPE